MDMFKRVFFVFILTLEGQAAFANPSMLIGVGGGVAFNNLSSSTSVLNGTAVPAPYNSDIFSIHTHSAGTLVLFGGYQWDRASSIIPHYNLTLHYEHQFSPNITGNVQEYALPTFTNYNYSMGLNSSILAIIGKVDLVKYKFLFPFVSAGMGVAFNSVGSYSEWPTPSVDLARISPHYGSNRNNNFAYTLGAGVDIISNNNTWVTLAYEYWNLGKVNSGSGTELWSSTRLNFGTLTSNTFLVTVTHFFE